MRPIRNGGSAARISMFCAVLACAGLASAAVRPDPWLTANVKIALLSSDQVHGMDVNVDTIDGKVTLHGVVESQAEREKAERVARAVEGVTEVRNLLQVSSGTRKDVMMRADGELAKDVAAALQARRSLRDSDIRVKSVHDGVVLLEGRAASVSDHLQALSAAAGVNGVRRVETEIKSPDQMSDAELWNEGKASSPDDSDGSDLWITTKAKLKLLLDSKVPVGDINVDTHAGNVTLFGTVPSADAKEAASHAVRGLDGVGKVDNQLQVVAPALKEAVEIRDADLRQEIEQRLATHADLRDAQVKVEVAKGVVRLSGRVPSQTARFSALTAARITRGAQGLVDDMEVAYTDTSRP